MRSRLLAASAAVLLISLLTACGGSEEKASTDAGTCSYTKASEPGKKADLPPTEPKGVDALTIQTNRGAIKASLDPGTAPCTVSSFASLAGQGYFDGTKCHRLVPGFVLQCGDPSATGSGGPGYSFADELTGKETYPAGTLAMANAGPDTNGSQFFIVLAQADLPPEFTVFGTVDRAGLKIAQQIEKDGNGADGVSPAKDVVIEKVA
ncbi:MAG: peptidylprolyl isomerase [Aeromicrobium sp.]|nr:peptidylprolyl isomerase [Marmoricola sp.]MCW2770435.1 peptidylprolyl isomerase [Aeromicrobium sp.]